MFWSAFFLPSSVSRILLRTADSRHGERRIGGGVARVQEAEGEEVLHVHWCGVHFVIVHLHCAGELEGKARNGMAPLRVPHEVPPVRGEAHGEASSSYTIRIAWRHTELPRGGQGRGEDFTPSGRPPMGGWRNTDYSSRMGREYTRPNGGRQEHAARPDRMNVIGADKGHSTDRDQRASLC